MGSRAGQAQTESRRKQGKKWWLHMQNAHLSQDLCKHNDTLALTFEAVHVLPGQHRRAGLSRRVRHGCPQCHSLKLVTQTITGGHCCASVT